MSHRCIALLGIGHTNAEIVRRWSTSPIPGCRLVCISAFPEATYSGMLPGVLARQFGRQEMTIDLAALVKQASGEFLVADVTKVDPQARRIEFADGHSLEFDVLSVGVGSTASGLHEHDCESLVATKPMQTFIDRLDNRMDQLAPQNKSTLRFIVVGAGAAGIELSLCLHKRFENLAPSHNVSINIMTSSDDIGDGLHRRSVSKLRDLLSARGIEVTVRTRVIDVSDSGVTTRDGTTHPSDVVLWATDASPLPILSKSGLTLDQRGFIATQHTLQTVDDYPIFAVGDCGTIIDDPAPKAGVYAVRQAPVLWHNIRATVAGHPLREFVPQKSFLKILNTGDNKALLEYRSLAFHARWCWYLKTFIDRHFVGEFQMGSK